MTLQLLFFWGGREKEGNKYNLFEVMNMIDGKLELPEAQKPARRGVMQSRGSRIKA